MCGPIEKCCCCFPANVGVKFIGMFLILVDISSMIYCTIILQINNKVRLRSSVISLMTTFLLLSVLPRGAGTRDAQLHLVRGGGDIWLFCPHHHQHSSHHRGSQEKQVKLCDFALFLIFIFLKILFHSLVGGPHGDNYWTSDWSSRHHGLLHIPLSYR